jgi:16S rRNA G527 N7-methylase RsmG
MNHRENPQLQKFVSIFLEKNTHINLSAIRDEEGVWAKHIEDSLITLPLFEQFGDKKLKILDL